MDVEAALEVVGRGVRSIAGRLPRRTDLFGHGIEGVTDLREMAEAADRKDVDKADLGPGIRVVRDLVLRRGAAAHQLHPIDRGRFVVADHRRLHVLLMDEEHLRPFILLRRRSRRQEQGREAREPEPVTSHDYLP